MPTTRRRVRTTGRTLMTRTPDAYQVVFGLVLGIWLPVAAVTTDGRTVIAYYP